MDKETTFFDLCAAGIRAIGRVCVACWHVIEGMIRLTYRYWWVVLTIMALALGAGFYYTRTGNLTFKVNAVALLNGPTIQQFEQAFAPMRSHQLLPPGAPIAPYLHNREAREFMTFHVIDCLDDYSADYIDFSGNANPADTVNVIMQDRMCIQFRIKLRNMHMVPAIEEALLATLNADPAMQKSYEAYLPNLREEVAFNHRQFYKLDSLTSHYYYFTPSGQNPNAYVGNGVNFYGEREIHLFLDEIYEQHEYLQQKDFRLQMATAPVVLENHFAVDPHATNGRRKCLPIFFLLGWIGGCILAELIDKRKALSAWLKA